MDNRFRELAGRVRSGLRAAALDRPYETKWSIAGATLGILFGLVFGGVGVAAFGQAIGLPGLIVFPLLFGFLGNRYGIGKDRKALLIERQE
ncbi:hypothetical protein [Mesorhizobium sophorae]|uniref:hypothetical protein n=1 Tax=Mesorhizobium sophorae TaxID=1300294 RepID=UPI000BA31EAD|nr:hypothetical protein [Mesorhizobium sophorae]